MFFAVVGKTFGWERDRAGLVVRFTRTMDVSRLMPGSYEKSGWTMNIVLADKRE